MMKIRKPVQVVTTLIALAFFDQVYAQEESRAIIVQSGEFYVEANILPKVHATSVGKDLTYFWFRGNQINSTVGAYNSNLLHGKYTSYYASKNLKELGAFERGLKIGVWESWYKSGFRDQVIAMKHGKRNGRYKKFNSDGELILEGTYKDGKLHGYLITYHLGKELLRRQFKKGEEIITEEPPENSVPRKSRLKNIWPFKKTRKAEPEINPKKKPDEEIPESNEPQKT